MVEGPACLQPQDGQIPGDQGFVEYSKRPRVADFTARVSNYPRAIYASDATIPGVQERAGGNGAWFWGYVRSSRQEYTSEQLVGGMLFCFLPCVKISERRFHHRTLASQPTMCFHMFHQRNELQTCMYVYVHSTYQMNRISILRIQEKESTTISPSSPLLPTHPQPPL